MIYERKERSSAPLFFSSFVALKALVLFFYSFFSSFFQKLHIPPDDLMNLDGKKN